MRIYIGELTNDPTCTVIRNRARYTPGDDDPAGIIGFLVRTADTSKLEFDVCDTEGRFVTTVYGSPLKTLTAALRTQYRIDERTRTLVPELRRPQTRPVPEALRDALLPLQAAAE